MSPAAPPTPPSYCAALPASTANPDKRSRTEGTQAARIVINLREIHGPSSPSDQRQTARGRPLVGRLRGFGIGVTSSTCRML